MARISVDDSVFRDPRVHLLAKRLGISRRETLGSLLCVWAICYDRVSVFLPALEVDIAAELDGFAVAMVAVGLAEEAPEGVRVRGAEDRIGYLERQAERGRKGGVASGLSRTANAALAKPVLSAIAQNRSVRLKRRNEANEAPSKPPDPVPDSASAPVPDSAPDLASPKEEEYAVGTASPARPKLKLVPKYTGPELESARRVLERLSERAQRRYTGSQAHLAIIIARLRSGYTEDDLRRIVAHCAEARGWSNPESEMHAYLRPETLFGPKTIEKYVYDAREYRKNEQTLSEQEKPPEPEADPYVGDAWKEPSWMTR